MVTYEPWKIIRLIGSGSFGSVYEIEREELSVVYKAALKVISIPPSEDEIRTMRNTGMDEASISGYYQSEASEIIHEISIMNALKGTTNIVSYEDHRVIPHENGIGYDILIRMELLTSLTDYINANGFSEENVIRLGIDLCTALEYCRKYGVIHRDIKPDNIFISQFGDFKLGDFGIARVAEKTQAGMSRKGTMNYMAPEVYVGSPYNHTVDIYSLGIVMYQLYNHGRLPFLPSYPAPITYKDIESAFTRRLQGEALPYPGDKPSALGEIIRKACSFRPENRYYEPSEMRAALEQLLGKNIPYPDYAAGNPANAEATTVLGIGTANRAASASASAPISTSASAHSPASVSASASAPVRGSVPEKPAPASAPAPSIPAAEKKPAAAQPQANTGYRVTGQPAKKKGIPLLPILLGIAAVIAVIVIASGINKNKNRGITPEGTSSANAGTASERASADKASKEAERASTDKTSAESGSQDSRNIPSQAESSTESSAEPSSETEKAEPEDPFLTALSSVKGYHEFYSTSLVNGYFYVWTISGGRSTIVRKKAGGNDTETVFNGAEIGLTKTPILRFAVIDDLMIVKPVGERTIVIKDLKSGSFKSYELEGTFLYNLLSINDGVIYCISTDLFFSVKPEGGCLVHEEIFDDMFGVFGLLNEHELVIRENYAYGALYIYDIKTHAMKGIADSCYEALVIDGKIYYNTEEDEIKSLYVYNPKDEKTTFLEEDLFDPGLYGTDIVYTKSTAEWAVYRRNPDFKSEPSEIKLLHEDNDQYWEYLYGFGEEGAFYYIYAGDNDAGIPLYRYYWIPPQKPEQIVFLYEAAQNFNVD